MGWIHCRRRGGATLALIALAVQIIFAFGHVHLYGVAQNAIASITRPVALADKNSQTPAPIPGDNDDYCAVCASIFLTSTAFTPAPPQLPLPANFERVEHSFNAVTAVAARPHLAFQSRAPPAA